MSELSDFFAKKTSKSKKKAAVNVGMLGERLERCVQLQDQQEKERPAAQVVVNDSGAPSADSEWIDPSAEPAASLADLGIKEMAIADISEEDASEDENVVAAAPKTWNTEKKTVESDAVEAAPAAAAPTVGKYRPPGKYVPANKRQQAVRLDLTSDEMFPTLAAADEKVKEDKLKADEKKVDKNNGWIVQGGARGYSSASTTNQSVLSKGTSGAYRPPAARSGTSGGLVASAYPRPAPSKPVETAAPAPAAAPKPGKYVPPNRRQ